MDNKNSELTIYGDLMSQPVRGILAFCKLNKIEYKFKLVNLAKLEQYSEEFKKINPLSKVPVITLVDKAGKVFVLKESATILRFLSQFYNVSQNWYPKEDLIRRSKIDEMLDWYHLNTRYVLASIFFKKIVEPKLNFENNSYALPDMSRMAPKILKHLDVILSKQKYLIGDEISIADLLYVSEINQFLATEYDISSYKNLTNYMNRVNSIEEVKSAHEVLKKFIDKNTQNKAKF